MIILTLAGTMIAGCAKPESHNAGNVSENTGNANHSLTERRTEYLAEWQTFKREAAKNIDASEKELKSLRRKMARDGSKLTAQYDKEVTLLEQRNRDLKKRLDDYNAGGQTEWEAFKTRVQHDLDEVESTMTEVSRKIQ